MAWTEERVRKLTLLWKSGNSASKIAIELGKVFLEMLLLVKFTD